MPPIWEHWDWVAEVAPLPPTQHPPTGCSQARCASDKEEKNLPPIWEHWDWVAEVAPLPLTQHPPIGCSQARCASDKEE